MATPADQNVVINPRLGGLALTAGIVGISAAPIFVQLSDIGPTATAVWRMAFALPLLTLWMLMEDRQNHAARRLTRRDWAIIALAGLLFTGDLMAWHNAIRLSGVANATFLGNLTPLVVTLGAWLMLKEKITGGFMAGLFVALGGAGLLIFSSATGETGSPLGDALGVLTALMYGAYLFVIKMLRGALPTGTIMALSGVFSAASLLVAALIMGESLIPATLAGWGILLGIALVSQAGGQALITLAFRHLPASLASTTMLANPVLAAIAGWIILGESLGPLQGAACGVVLAGIAIAQRFGRR